MTARVVVVRADEGEENPAEGMRDATRRAAGYGVGLVVEGIDPAAVVVRHDGAGRPEAHLAAPDGTLSPLAVGLSLSHAGGWGAALAWCDDD